MGRQNLLKEFLSISQPDMSIIVRLIIWEMSVAGATIILVKSPLQMDLLLRFQLAYDTLVALMVQEKSNVGEIIVMNKVCP